MKNPKTVFPLPQFDSLDFDTLKVAYFGPDDAANRTGGTDRPVMCFVSFRR